MSNVAHQNQGDAGLQLTLRIWHPEDWTIEITEDNPGGILANTVYNTADTRVKGQFTLYGDSSTEVEALVEATKNSRLTNSVIELRERCDQTGSISVLGEFSRKLFVEYDTDYSVNTAIGEHGFIREEPIHIHDGWEYWPVFFSGDRPQMEDRLKDLRNQMDADVTITRGGGTSRTEDVWRVDNLSEGQREAFELARRRGYYEWPRNISARELADEMDISKTTFLEHLRKAESKLLDP